MRRCKSEKVGDFKMGVMDVIKYNGDMLDLLLDRRAWNMVAAGS